MKYLLFLFLLMATLGSCTSGTPQGSENTSKSPEAKKSSPQVRPTSPLEIAKPPLEVTALDGLEWMIGTWKQEESQTRISYETWEMVTKDRYAGTSWTMQMGDTIWKETLEIKIENNNAVYYATVPENDGPVGFAMTKNEPNRVDFENPMHDFPWKISYWRGADTLRTRIAGFRNGKAAFNDLVMLKVK